MGSSAGLGRADHVPPPKITVQQRGWLLWHQFRQPVGQIFDLSAVRGGEDGECCWFVQVAQDPLLGKECMPIKAPGIVLGQQSEIVSGAEPETLGRDEVQAGYVFTQPGPTPLIRRPGAKVLKGEPVTANIEDPGEQYTLGGGQCGQTDGFGFEHAGRCVGARFDHHQKSVGPRPAGSSGL